jgi:hypothetical protein
VFGMGTGVTLAVYSPANPGVLLVPPLRFARSKTLPGGVSRTADLSTTLRSGRDDNSVATSVAFFIPLGGPKGPCQLRSG